MGCDIHAYAERRVSQRALTANVRIDLLPQRLRKPVDRALRHDTWEKIGAIFPSDIDGMQRALGNGELTDELFSGVRHYGLFGWLADVRNYSAVPPISQPRGLPDDVSSELYAVYMEEEPDSHSATWLSLDELIDFNYDAYLEDRRVMINGNGGCTARPGEGVLETYRGFLPDVYFRDLEILAHQNDPANIRIILWFDN